MGIFDDEKTGWKNGNPTYFDLQEANEYWIRKKQDELLEERKTQIEMTYAHETHYARKKIEEVQFDWSMSSYDRDKIIREQQFTLQEAGNRRYQAMSFVEADQKRLDDSRRLGDCLKVREQFQLSTAPKVVYEPPKFDILETTTSKVDYEPDLSFKLKPFKMDFDY